MRKFTVIALCCVPLAGCVGFSSDKAKVNNISQIAPYDTALQVQVGDSLQKLYQLMGDPSSIGIDESGKPYLRYMMLEQKSKAITLQILGFIHASTYNYPTGYELQVFYEKDTITAINRKRYITEPGDNSLIMGSKP